MPYTAARKRGPFLHCFKLSLKSNWTAVDHPFQTLYTVIGRPSGSLHSKWISQYLRHFSTEMAEIWSPGTFFEDVWTHKISALNHLYFQSYETFKDITV